MTEWMSPFVAFLHEGTCFTESRNGERWLAGSPKHTFWFCCIADDETCYVQAVEGVRTPASVDRLKQEETEAALAELSGVKTETRAQN